MSQLLQTGRLPHASNAFVTLQENRRLQSKLLKLDLGGSPQGNAAADSEIMALQSENAELRDDNDKLVNYLENLDKRKKELEDALMNNFGEFLGTAWDDPDFPQTLQIATYICSNSPQVSDMPCFMARHTHTIFICGGDDVHRVPADLTRPGLLFWSGE